MILLYLLIFKHCDINEIGNEYHFLMSCRNSKFISLRNNLCKINRSFCLFTQQDIFRYIMAIQNKTIMNLVAKYCYDILAVFESLNYVISEVVIFLYVM